MEYQSNSHKSKREAENNDRVKKETIAKGKLIKKKKGMLEKIVSAFVNEDVENVKEYLDVLITFSGYFAYRTVHSFAWKHGDCAFELYPYPEGEYHAPEQH